MTVSLSQIASRAEDNAWSLADLDWSRGVDHTRMWFPERLTPLSFTSVYELLSDEERLQYNQWYATGVNEQFIWLEVEVLNGVVLGLLRRPGLIPAELRPLLETFVAEEDKHTEVFRRLQRCSRPDDYEHSDYHFFRPGRLSQAMTRIVARAPQHFVAWPFLAMALEEKTVAFYRGYERALIDDGAELCPLYRRAHKLHMLDETRHIHIDQHLIDVLWTPAPAWKRALNAKLLVRSLAQYTSPRPRSVSVNIVHALCDKFPRLEVQRERIVHEVRDLKNNPAYQAHVYGRSSMPRTFAAFDRTPELARVVGQVAPGYTPEFA